MRYAPSIEIKMKKVRVLITKSRYSFRRNCEFNKGSLAVVITTTEAIRKFIPEAEIRTFIQLSQRVAGKYNITVVKRRLNKFGDFRLINSIENSVNLLMCVLWKLIFNSFGFDVTSLKNTEILREFEQANVIVDLSLDSYGDNDIHSFLETSKEILMAKLLKKPVIFYAQSMGPFRNEFNSLIAKYVLNKVDIITVREEISYNYLIELGIVKPLLYLTADPAFLLEPISSKSSYKIVKGELDGNRPIIGIAISKMREFNKSRTKRMKLIAKLYSWILYLFPEFLIKIINDVARKAGVLKIVEQNIDLNVTLCHKQRNTIHMR